MNGKTIQEVKNGIIKASYSKTIKDPFWRFLYYELCQGDPSVDDFQRIRDWYQKTIEIIENHDWH